MANTIENNPDETGTMGNRSFTARSGDTILVQSVPFGMPSHRWHLSPDAIFQTASGRFQGQPIRQRIRGARHLRLSGFLCPGLMRERTMKTLIACIAMTITMASPLAYAKGCLAGGAAGAVGGHYAGHHAVLGAAGGCVAGHEIAKHHERKREEQARDDQSREDHSDHAQRQDQY